MVSVSSPGAVHVRWEQGRSPSPSIRFRFDDRVVGSELTLNVIQDESGGAARAQLLRGDQVLVERGTSPDREGFNVSAFPRPTF